MTVQELLELLEDAEPNAEVRLATQPNYPLAFDLAGVTMSEDVDAPGDTWDGPVVWLCQGEPSDSPYGVPRGVWDNPRW